MQYRALLICIIYILLLFEIIIIKSDGQDQTVCAGSYQQRAEPATTLSHQGRLEIRTNPQLTNIMAEEGEREGMENPSKKAHKSGKTLTTLEVC